MSEETEGQDTGAEAVAGGVDPAAVALALSGASREKADAFLDEQRKLVQLQAKELSHELGLRHWSLWVRHASGVLKLTLELCVGLLLLAIVAGVGIMVWNAAHAEGYVIESLAVPPDMAARGLTGEVVAARLLDRLNVVQTPPPASVAAPQAISAGSSDDVKVEIPETGISAGELYRFLRRWLGHETHVSGEVVREAQGLAVAVRINGKDGATYEGPEADFDALLQKAAEHVFHITAPMAYPPYLLSRRPPRKAEALAVYQQMFADPAATPQLRASGWNGLGNLSLVSGDLREALLLYRRAREADPTYPLGYTNAIGQELNLGDSEAALALLPQAMAVFEKGHDRYSPAAVTGLRAILHAQDAELRGDYARAVSEAETAAAQVVTLRYGQLLGIASDRARLHDGAAIAWLAQQPQPESLPAGAWIRLARPFQMEAALQHWPRVVTMAAECEKAISQSDFSETGRELFSAVVLRPWLALAKARTGNIAGAESLIAATPSDCYDCIRIRGLIASEARQWERADYWFAKAVNDAPSIPFAREDRGRTLLARGLPDAAIEEFKFANQKGPKFADPLEGWGEALMAKNRSDLALAKFEEAEKYAPNWGRLHMKWGEALFYAGKADEAKAEFVRAAQLDLTAADKTELARQSPHA